jgi:hypothetical protein
MPGASVGRPGDRVRYVLVSILLAVLFAAFAAARLLPEQTHALRQRALGGESTLGTDPRPVEPEREAAASPDAGVDAAAPPATVPLLRRPLRVVGLGADLLAPGLLARSDPSGGFAGAHLPVELAVAPTAAAIETALALGGEQPGGADVAVLPLPTFVASYERLRALDPTIFIVTGRSRGREALAALPGVSLRQPSTLPAADALALRGPPGSAEGFFALAILDLAGLPLDGVRFVAADAEAADRAPFEAVPLLQAGATPPRRILVSTAEATGLVPFVAVTPRGFLARNREALVVWSRIWLASTEALLADVPAAARQIMEVEGKGDPVALVGRLGAIRMASLRDNASLAGLSGRGAVTLDQLFAWSWRLWRAMGVLSTPAPEGASFDPSVITALVQRAERDALAPSPPPRQESAQGELLVSPGPRGASADDELVARLGLLAGVFERSQLVVTTAAGPRRTAELLQQAAERYGLEPGRLSTGKARLEGRAWRVDVRAPK